MHDIEYGEEHAARDNTAQDDVLAVPANVDPSDQLIEDREPLAHVFQPAGQTHEDTALHR